MECGGKRLHGLYDGTAEIVQTHWKQRGAIIHVEQGRWSVLGDAFLQGHAQALGGCVGYFINEGVLTEQTADL